MNTTARIAISMMTLALIGSLARAQGTDPQTAAAQAAAELKAVRLQQERAIEALAADQTAAAQDRQKAEQQAAVVQDRKQVEKEAARVQEARAQAERNREMALYDQGTAALDQARYARAQEAFAAAVALKGSRIDGALYWKAFALYKLAEMQAALGTLQELQTSFPDSRWLKEARALELEVKGASGAPVSPGATQDEELKLLALNGLLQTDADQALPMLEKLLNSQQSPQLKKRALFVLSQSKSPKSKGIVTAIAKGSSNPDLQLEALRYLGMFGGLQDKQTLADIYAASKDRDVKREILKAYLIGGEIEALAQVARSDADPAMRTRAVQMLYISGSYKTGDALAGLYWVNGQSKEVRAEIVNGLFAQGDAKALVEIARKETDPSMRKRIVERLSRMRSKDATDYLMELINK